MDATRDLLLVGDPCANTPVKDAGAIHVYEVQNSGNQAPVRLLQTLSNPNPTEGARFAGNWGAGKQTVATDGNHIYVGTPRTFLSGGSFQQGVEVFSRNPNGTFFHKRSISSPVPGTDGFEGYGQSVSLLPGALLAIGQLSDGMNPGAGGRVFLFDLE